MIWDLFNTQKIEPDLGPMYTMPQKFENRGFTLTKHQMFSIQATLDKFKNKKLTSRCGFVFEEISVKEFT